MIDETITESSESILSPSGKYSVVVSSSYQTSKPTEGLSQAMVSEPEGGSGLITFYFPRISMGFTWKSDTELVISYPNDLSSPRIDATNSSFGMGGRGSVIYRAVPRNEIRSLRWRTTEETITILAEEVLERGALVTFKMGDQIEYLYSYYDVSEPDSSHELLQSRGLQGGGCSWEGIVRGLVSLRAPDVLEFLNFDPEGDGLVIKSTNRDALVTVSHLIVASKREQALLNDAIERAIQGGEME